jgi:hypothetical protein
MIEKLERVELRKVWKHESHFSDWLANNSDILNDVLDFSLINIEREKAVGSFNVDLVAEDERGNVVVIENQYGKSDHDHLGKLLTYLTAIEAKKAIWIVEEPRPEHIQAINWQNESGIAEFYIIKLEAVKIGNSSSAPLLTKIIGPSLETKEIGVKKKEYATKNQSVKLFWAGLLEGLNTKTNLFKTISPQAFHWLSKYIRGSAMGYSFVIRKKDADVLLFIQPPANPKKEFEELKKHKSEIESIFGDVLEWDEKEGRETCYIRKKIEIGGLQDENKWPVIQQTMADTMIKLEKALSSFIKMTDS